MTGHGNASQLWAKFPHLLLAAWFLASVAAILHLQFHILQGLDEIFLRIAAPAVLEDAQSQLRNRRHGGSCNVPTVIGIGNTYYEDKDTFRQQSPLSRDELAALLAKILARSPKVLAVDLDLSPGPTSAEGSPEPRESQANDEASSAKSREALYALLEAARSPRESDHDATPRQTPRIVLIAPFPVHTRELREEKLDWMKGMCDAGIAFAASEVRESQGVVLRYYVDNPSLGRETWLLDEEEPQAASLICVEASKAPAAGGLLSYLMPHPYQETLARANDKAAKQLAPRALNFQSIPHLRVHTLESKEDLEARLEQPDAGLKIENQVVFFGGVYGSEDLFLTPAGEVQGLLLHAIEYVSRACPVTDVSPVVVYIVEIVIGVLVGAAFLYIWTGYGRAKQRADGNDEARVWLWAGGLIFVVLIVVMPYASTHLLVRQLWINPAPILIGMPIKAFSASLEVIAEYAGRSVSTGEKEAGGSKLTSVGRWFRIVNWAVFVVVIVWALVLLAQDH